MRINYFLLAGRLSEKVTFNEFTWPVCLPLKMDLHEGSGPGNEAPTLFDRTENEILPEPNEKVEAEGKKRNPEPEPKPITRPVMPSSSSPGIVVGWGAVEKYGDSGASRGFLKELNKKKFAVVRNERNLTQVLNVADMEDVLRLRKVELPFIDHFTCEQWYSSRGRPIRLIEAQFCAGLYEGGKDACRVSEHMRTWPIQAANSSNCLLMNRATQVVQS